jgi:hypothetical protein
MTGRTMALSITTFNINNIKHNDIYQNDTICMLIFGIMLENEVTAINCLNYCSVFHYWHLVPSGGWAQTLDLVISSRGLYQFFLAMIS